MMAALAHGARLGVEVVGQLAVLHAVHEGGDVFPMAHFHGFEFIGQPFDYHFIGDIAGAKAPGVIFRLFSMVSAMPNFCWAVVTVPGAGI